MVFQGGFIYFVTLALALVASAYASEWTSRAYISGPQPALRWRSGLIAVVFWTATIVLFVLPFTGLLANFDVSCASGLKVHP